MQTSYKPLWISSIAHVQEFYTITNRNPWWKTLLSIQDVPNDFPQVKLGSKGIPLVYFSRGELIMYERQIDFKSDSVNQVDKMKYKNLRTDLNFEIEYTAITKIERYLYPKPSMKFFNLPWISLSLSNNGIFDNILLSMGGTGLEMGVITKINDSLFEEIKMKAEH